MDEFDNVTKKVSDAFYTAVRKSGEFVENAKISYNISLEKDKIVKLQSKIGARIYSLYKNGESSPEIEAFEDDLKAIGALEENIKNLEKGITEKRAYIVCSECGVKLEGNSVYCPKCGTKQGSSDT